MTKTRAELVTAAAYRLSAIGSGQSLESEDGERIDDQIDPLLAQLATDGIVDISDDTEIPAEYFKALTELLANNCAEEFGMKYSEEKKLTFESHLRRTTAGRPTYETLKSDYY